MTTDRNTIKYNDGELILNDDATLTAIGATANKAMFRIMSIETKRGCWLNYRELADVFYQVNNCTLILGIG